MFPPKLPGIAVRHSQPPTSSYPLDPDDATLPYIHDAFPATLIPRLGQARNYTMRTMGSHPTGNPTLNGAEGQEVISTTLPELGINRECVAVKRSKELPSSGANYINNHKTVMRLRGLSYSELYGSTSTRNKGDLSVDGTGRRKDKEDTFLGQVKRYKALKKIGENPRTTRSEGALDLDKEYRLPDMHPHYPRDSQSTVSGLLPSDKMNDKGHDPEVPLRHNTARDTMEDDDSVTNMPLWDKSNLDNGYRKGVVFEQRMRDVVDVYKGTPGWKPRKRNFGRKLGNVVSSNRLSQLLESKQPLKMENFYNYYP